MKLVYAVAGEGMGHATRSKPVIEHLKKKHQVRIFAGGKALPYLRKHFSVRWLASTHIIYRDNAVHETRSILYNMLRSPLYGVSLVQMLFVMLFRRPDAVVTDFEPWSAWAAMLTGVPVVSIDNENVITRAQLSLPKGHRKSFIKAWIITRLIVPYAKAILIPSFFFPPLKTAKAQYVQPIIRKQIVSRTPTIKNHVLVYQTSSSNEQLLDTLKAFPRQEFVMYGFPRDDREQNLQFKRFNEQEFVDDLASAKAVIANGGFSLLCEAIRLRKPVLSIPVAFQCEQIINAHYLAKLGYGMTAREATPAALKRFFSNLPQQREALKETGMSGIPSVFPTIEKVLNDVAA